MEKNVLFYSKFFIFLLFISLPAVASDRKDDVRKVIINNDGLYQLTNTDKTTSIYIPKSAFVGYDYITIRTNKDFGTRVHILKEIPQKNNEAVLYSDYYKQAFDIRKDIVLDIVIPEDAKCIYILRSGTYNYNPVDIKYYKKESLSDVNASQKQCLTRTDSEVSQKFMHWNIGNFSQGKFPYSNITKDNFVAKLNDFNKFIDTYCPDCHYLLNEYNDTFATIEGAPVSTPLLLFTKRLGYRVFPRTTSSAFNNLAIFWKEGFKGYQYGLFESLKGVKNANGVLQYGTGYCISEYEIGGKSLYVMNLHAPNAIKSEEHNALYNEILGLCAQYDNFIIVGDLNRTSVDGYKLLTDAGFKILNDNTITAPVAGYVFDWVLYRCKDLTVTDYKVYTKEAVDSKGEILSDHLPISFTVNYNNNN